MRILKRIKDDGAADQEKRRKQRLEDEAEEKRRSQKRAASKQASDEREQPVALEETGSSRDGLTSPKRKGGSVDIEDLLKEVEEEDVGPGGAVSRGGWQPRCSGVGCGHRGMGCGGDFLTQESDAGTTAVRIERWSGGGSG